MSHVHCVQPNLEIRITCALPKKKKKLFVTISVSCFGWRCHVLWHAFACPKSVTCIKHMWLYMFSAFILYILALSAFTFDVNTAIIQTKKSWPVYTYTYKSEKKRTVFRYTTGDIFTVFLYVSPVLSLRFSLHCFCHFKTEQSLATIQTNAFSWISLCTQSFN